MPVAPLDSIQVPQRPVVTIAGASLGTVFEWYDFFLYGSVASVIAAHFFSGVSETTAYILALLTFAVGFAVRPLGGYIFGRIGDRIGRKQTFLATMAVMGAATVFVGLLPTQSSIGVAAPILLVIARLVQGLAMGGEYGGAAIYVAEHCPPARRGFYTSFIQVTATAGLILSLLATLATRTTIGEEAFVDWGWRIPFLLSALLLLFSVWFRKGLQETPEFNAMAAEAAHAKASPSKMWTATNVRRMLLALFGLCAGMTVIWYTGQFYTLFFLERVVKVDSATAQALLSIALLLATPFFIFFGWASDRVGRLPIILAACLLAAISYPTLFRMLTEAANPGLARASEQTTITLVADASRCSTQFDPVGRSQFLTSCDIAKSELAKAGISYSQEAARPGALAQVRIGRQVIDAFEGEALSAASITASKAAFHKKLGAAFTAHGFPPSADPKAIHWIGTIAVLLIINLLATMCYGPLIAALTEIFPVADRYTSLSLPYNIATGWIGGFLPAAAFAIVVSTGNIYAGLWYPTAFALITLAVGCAWALVGWLSGSRLTSSVAPEKLV